MENQRLETAKMLMSFYNMIAGTRFRIGDNNRKVDEIMDAVDRANGSMRDIKAHIRTWVKENPESAKNSAMDCFREYSPIIQAPAVEQASQPTDVTPQAANNALGLLEQAVVKMISETSAEKIESEIMGTVEDKVRQFIKDEYGTIERKVTTIIDGKPKDMQGVTHEKFETILKFVANNEPVFLAGPAGSGKNVICKQVAEALGLKFYFTNAVTQEYKLTGFTDANGNYQPTQFFKAFTEGGVFMLDEMDASIPEVLIILNAAIANGYFDFPAPIGKVNHAFVSKLELAFKRTVVAVRDKIRLTQRCIRLKPKLRGLHHRAEKTFRRALDELRICAHCRQHHPRETLRRDYARKCLLNFPLHTDD